MKAKRLMTSIGVAVLLASAMALPGTASADNDWHNHGRAFYGNHFYGPPGHYRHYGNHVGGRLVFVDPVLVQPYAVYAPPPVVYSPYPFAAYPGSGVSITFSGVLR
jgi:hypothetical protein